MSIKKSGRWAGPTIVIVGALALSGIALGFVANPDRCLVCHSLQVQFWRGTLHSSAYLTLFAKNAHLDPDCAKCHTLGLNAPGGFDSISKPIEWKRLPADCPPDQAAVECFLTPLFGGKVSPIDSRLDPERYRIIKTFYHEKRAGVADNVLKDFLNVQCEHCHGDREIHLKTGKRTGRPVKEATCRQCHTPERDPAFTFKKVKLIACPLMKKK
ncbi:MAG: hypothetical protein HYR96_11790 [Deltaproteobacteria bacterium]|nr:hypothetical protein [Deltaproteobacteria bacterium]MBI3293716.1 hypothetical protein [Deltaproteobacteria bacterium]